MVMWVIPSSRAMVYIFSSTSTLTKFDISLVARRCPFQEPIGEAYLWLLPSPMSCI